jgi:hypothetical protein
VDYRPLRSIRESYSKEDTNSRIGDALSNASRAPFYVARIGSTELKAMVRTVLLDERSLPEKTFAAIARLEPPIWTKSRFADLASQAGFFPLQKEAVTRYVNLLRSSLQEVDLFGSWVDGENVFASELEKAEVGPAPLDPFSFPHAPWSAKLAGQRVLVVHPFANTIRRQYLTKREHLFPGLTMLPEFQLDVLRAPLTLNSPDREITGWFKLLEEMTNEARKRKFDVAILGCGSYGVPLGAKLKEGGKKVISLGGPTQLLFGIKGRRWDQNGFGSKWYNDAWVYPAEVETPKSKPGQTMDYWP